MLIETKEKEKKDVAKEYTRKNKKKDGEFYEKFNLDRTNDSDNAKEEKVNQE